MSLPHCAAPRPAVSFVRWPITVIIVIVVLVIPALQIHVVLADVITLSALLMGVGVPAERYRVGPS
ncbi:hypothetical protein [Streptacidiphilus sp. EB103A]|uniref:hypothetical protein n=1 Tax=Streptacidiphilus sp. EB103A TaxID=3156275 RepID=UPI0035155AAA